MQTAGGRASGGRTCAQRSGRSVRDRSGAAGAISGAAGAGVRSAERPERACPQRMAGAGVPSAERPG
jgi:hypothetical protein